MRNRENVKGIAARAAMWSARHRTLAILGWLAFVVGATPVGWLLVAAVGVLQTLLATTGICVGCYLYVLRWWVPSQFARLFRRTDELVGLGPQQRIQYQDR